MSRSFHDALKALAAREARFFASDFLAPVLRGQRVAVRIAGALCTMRVGPASFQGWAICHADKAAEAHVVRAATLSEREHYLKALPRERLVLCGRDGERLLGMTEQSRAVVPVYLVQDAEQFETIDVRFDGARHWFDGACDRQNPATAAYLREVLRQKTEVDRLARSGLMPAERAVYAFARAVRLETERAAKESRDERKLRIALDHAGAELRGFAEREGAFRVEYTVDDERYISLVDKEHLAVQVAGICLSGEDARFDLQSLVGVLREARSEDAPRVGTENGGMDEDLYRRVHPPR
jgi:hypothetical protein